MSEEQPRIFVGTMYSGEGDFQSCVDAIRSQAGVTVTHSIISNMKEKEAHNALWKAWRAERDSHVLFVKVDADTVLRDANTLLNIYSEFARNPRVTGLQAPLHDYMTNSLISGLNVFNTRVTFRDTQDELYCDRSVDECHDVVLRSNDLPTDLIPAGYHCHHAHERQAFHYGLHRMLKGQTMTLDQVWQAWVRDRDRTRFFALVGAHMSPRFMTNRRFNYSDTEFEEAFLEAEARYDELLPHYVARANEAR